jgi:hypothetical protein
MFASSKTTRQPHIGHPFAGPEMPRRARLNAARRFEHVREH